MNFLQRLFRRKKNSNPRHVAETEGAGWRKDQAPGDRTVTPASNIKRKEDGSFWGALPEELPAEREVILSLFRQLPVLSKELLDQFHRDAEYNKDIVKKTGTIEQTVDFAIAKTIEDARLIRSHVARIKKVDIQCEFTSRAYMENKALKLCLWRRFTNGGSDCVTTYLVRRDEESCEVRYMPHWK